MNACDAGREHRLELGYLIKSEMDTTSLGLDRFDEQGRSKIPPDPIALPFPQSA